MFKERRVWCQPLSIHSFIYIPPFCTWPHFSKTENLQRTVRIVHFYDTQTHTQWKSCPSYALIHTDHVLWPQVILIGNNVFFLSTDRHFKLSHTSRFNQRERETLRASPTATDKIWFSKMWSDQDFNTQNSSRRCYVSDFQITHYNSLTLRFKWILSINNMGWPKRQMFYTVIARIIKCHQSTFGSDILRKKPHT